jgi:hypothetical protein
MRELLSRIRGFGDDAEPQGGVRARLPSGPMSRPGADAVSLPQPTYWMDCRQNGVSQAEYASPR